ncbi:MAG: FAD-dependent oxidoreductase [Alphaproteobacteria bacterium]
MPERFDVVIVGGGIVGASIAYHLTAFGARSVALLERNAVASQATSRAAALLRHVRYKAEETPLTRHTYDLIPKLEEDLGESFGFRRTGGIHLVTSPERHATLEQCVSAAASAGIEVQWIDTAAAKRHVPWLDAGSALAIAFTPSDGVIDPHAFAHAYARLARRRGAVIRQQAAVTGLLRSGHRVRGVQLGTESIEAAIVIDAAGAWASLLAWEAGFGLGMAPVRSHYWITTPDGGFPPSMPFVLMPDANVYVRPERGGLVIGLREAQSVSVDPRTLPPELDGFQLSGGDDSHQLLVNGFPRLKPFFPELDKVRFQTFVEGLTTYTLDGRFLLGPVPGVDGFFAAAGCCGNGIAASGGIGRAMAELCLGRPAFADLAPFRLDRFGAIDPFDAEFRRQCATARSTKFGAGRR